MQETVELEAPPAPPMDPARAAELQRQMTAITTALIDRVLADIAAGQSTGSVSERLLMAALRPYLPKLRAVLLSKLSEADPAGVERLLGATSTAIEGILYHAPGEALPRMQFGWTAEGSLTLVPLEAVDA
jgi:hypothetical protein